MADDLLVEKERFFHLFKFLQSTDEAVDRWAAAIEAHIDAVPKKEPFFILLDVSGENVEFTGRARQHSKRIFSTYGERRGYIALLFEWRTSPYFARLFFASLGRLRFERNFFHDRETAVSWLEEMHEKENSR